MGQKKLSIKKKGDKLVIHKNEPAKKEVVEDEMNPEELEQKIEADAGEMHEASKKKHKKLKTKKNKGTEPPPWDDIDSSGGEGQQVVGTVEHNGEVSEEVLGEVIHHKPMANVGYNMSRSINLGNYESLKVGVSINIPSKVDVDEIEENYEFAKGWCEQKLEEVVEDYS